jgi:hypothetical protein
MPREISRKSLPTGPVYDLARDIDILSQEPSADEIKGERDGHDELSKIIDSGDDIEEAELAKDDRLVDTYTYDED